MSERGATASGYDDDDDERGSRDVSGKQESESMSLLVGSKFLFCRLKDAPHSQLNTSSSVDVESNSGLQVVQ